MKTEGSQRLNWYGARIVGNRRYVSQYLTIFGVEKMGIADIPSLIFMHCTADRILKLKYEELRGHIYVYRQAGDKAPDPIPDKDIKMFSILAPFHDTPVIYLPVDDSSLFNGKRKRVTGGLFKGCEGVVKRIKGDRRLIIRLSAHAAIATPYIAAEFLEDIDD